MMRLWSMVTGRPPGPYLHGYALGHPWSPPAHAPVTTPTTHEFDYDDAPPLGPDWTHTYQGVGICDVQCQPTGVVMWNEPTNLTSATMTCRVCQHIVRCAPGETIKFNDPRLCVHLGGPATATHLPE